MKKIKEKIKSENNISPGLGRQGRGGIPIFFTFFVFCLLGFFQSAEAVIGTPGVNLGSTIPSINQGLVGWWTFDNQDILNGAVLDKSGNGNTGNLFGISTSTFYSQGKIGQGFKFDGTNDYFSTSNTFTPTGDFTVSAWVYVDRYASAWTTVFATSPYDSTDNFIVYVGSNGSWNIQIFGSGTDVAGNNTTSFATKKWKHAVLMKSSTSPYVRFYVDGVLVFSSTSNPSTSISRKLQVGGVAGGASYVGAKVDDVRIYNRSLSASEISQLYKQGQATIGVTQNSRSNQTTLDSGLVGYWTFNNQDMLNGAVKDKSGNGNTGSLMNIATSTFYTQGKIGQAGRFDGVNDYLIQSNTFGGLTAFTISLWVKTTESKSNATSWVRPHLFGKGSGGGASGDFGITTNNGYIGFWSGLNSGGDNSYLSSTLQINNNVWHHIVVSNNGTSATLYVDNVSTGSISTGLALDNLESFAIGARNDDTGVCGYAANCYHQGSYDDVRIYNRALSVSEISQLYKQGQATIGVTQNPRPNQTTLDSGLVGYWTFNNQDMLNGRVNDKSGNGNHGNLINIATSTFYTQGKLGQGFKFDGVNDYIRVPHSASYKSNNQAISFWMYPREVPSSGYDGVLGIFSSDANAFEVFMDSNSSVLSAGSYPWQLTYTIPAKNKWYHVYIETVSGSGKIYINGALVDTGTVTYGGASNTADFYIGSRGTSYFFPGTLDDVRIYNRALSVSEIKQLYNQGR